MNLEEIIKRKLNNGIPLNYEELKHYNLHPYLYQEPQESKLLKSRTKLLINENIEATSIQELKSKLIVLIDSIEFDENIETIRLSLNGLISGFAKEVTQP